MALSSTSSSSSSLTQLSQHDTEERRGNNVRTWQTLQGWVLCCDLHLTNYCVLSALFFSQKNCLKEGKVRRKFLQTDIIVHKRFCRHYTSVVQLRKFIITSEAFLTWWNTKFCLRWRVKLFCRLFFFLIRACEGESTPTVIGVVSMSNVLAFLFIELLRCGNSTINKVNK